jgi:hypothetical protein
MTMKRIRLTGTILESERGALLETDDGAIWKLKTENDTLPVSGTKVIVDAGIIDEFSLQVDWISASA